MFEGKRLCSLSPGAGVCTMLPCGRPGKLLIIKACMQARDADASCPTLKACMRMLQAKHGAGALAWQLPAEQASKLCSGDCTGSIHSWQRSAYGGSRGLRGGWESE